MISPLPLLFAHSLLLLPSASVHRLPITASHLPPNAYRLLLTDDYLPLTTYRLPRMGLYLLRTAHGLLLTAYDSRNSFFSALGTSAGSMAFYNTLKEEVSQADTYHYSTPLLYRCLLLTSCYSRLTPGYFYYMLVAACCSLLTPRYTLHTTCCLLFTAYSLLTTPSHIPIPSPSSVASLPPSHLSPYPIPIGWPQPVRDCEDASALTTHCLLFTAERPQPVRDGEDASALTTHCLLFTAERPQPVRDGEDAFVRRLRLPHQPQAVRLV